MKTALEAQNSGVKHQALSSHTFDNKVEGSPVSCSTSGIGGYADNHKRDNRGKKAGILLESGKKYGMLTFIMEVERKGDQRRGLFTCSCGKQKEAGLQHVKRGKVSSCGCYRSNRNKLGFLYANAKYSFIKNMKSPYDTGAAVIPRNHYKHHSDNEKACCDCGETKPLKAFKRKSSYYSDAPSGYISRCKDCQQAQQERREAKRQQRLEEKLALQAARKPKVIKPKKEKQPKAEKPVAPAPTQVTAIMKPASPMQPIIITLSIHTPEEAYKLYLLGYLSIEVLQQAGIVLPERGTEAYNDMQKKAIHRAVHQQFGYDYEALKSKSRKRKLVFPRQLYMFLLEKYTSMTQREIAIMFCKKDHTTVIHARDTIIDHLTCIGDSYEKAAINNLLEQYNFEG